jgi:hypothetical protein
MVRNALAVAAMAAGLGAAMPPDGLAQNAATPESAARLWLSYVDGGDYAKGWDRAGNPFKAKNTPAVLQDKIAPVREPLGAVMERRLFKLTFSDSAPGLPAGQYAAVQFHSRFAGKTRTDETVWLDMEQERWAVIGYFIGGAIAPPAAGTGAEPNLSNCTHDEQVQARLARMNGYTGGPKCNLPE